MTLKNAHNENLERNNDKFLKKEEGKYLDQWRAEKDKRQKKQNQ